MSDTFDLQDAYVDGNTLVYEYACGCVQDAVTEEFTDRCRPHKPVDPAALADDAQEVATP
jgi:hypothetical protein